MISYYPIVFRVKTGSTQFLDQSDDYQQVNLTIYQCQMSKLIYLSCRTHPDIAFVVGQLSCHNSDLCVRHLRIAKQGFKYLKNIITLVIK